MLMEAEVNKKRLHRFVNVHERLQESDTRSSMHQILDERRYQG